MLHEVLLALSGHPSPLFEHGKSENFPLINPAERALLVSVGHLANLHQTLRSNFIKLSTSHPSIICRAVANSVLFHHLSKFQQLILDVEKQVLSNDPSCVGAYNIVPLAGVVKQFDGWGRRLEWYTDLTIHMLPTETTGIPLGDSFTVCSGASVINYLRTSSRTGYIDIADAAVELECVADSVWLRLLSAWILHGQLSDLGSHDLFIKSMESPQRGQEEYAMKQELLPSFLDTETALSILFVGKTVNFFAAQSTRTLVTSFNSSMHITDKGKTASSVAQSMQRDHVHLLSTISVPIKPSILATIIKDIRRSLSNQLADEILPVHELTHTFYLLQKFFLGGQVDFYDTLIEQADKHIATRHLQLRVDSQNQNSGDLVGVVMKQGELTAILSRTWAKLAPFVHKGEIVEDDFEWAREHLRLTLSKYTMNEKPTDKSTLTDLSKLGLGTFNDLLLSTPAMLNLELGSTFSLFLSSGDLQIYSIMHTYLLGIRRGQNHISKLWRQASLRRHSCKLSPSKVEGGGRAISSTSVDRDRLAQKANAMRKVWASSGAAVFVLCELGGYLIDTVVVSSWHKFNSWAVYFDTYPNSKQIQSTASSLSTSHVVSESSRAGKGDAHNFEVDVQQGELNLPKDPEALSNAHRLYLLALVHSLLLTDSVFTRHLQGLLMAVDLLVGFVERLQHAQSTLEMHGGENQTDYLHQKLLREEDFLYNETKKASDKIDVAIQSLIKRLQEISISRSPAARVKGVSADFEPWDNTGSVEKLLVKLEFGAKVEE